MNMGFVRSSANWVGDAFKKLTPRCSGAINSVDNAMDAGSVFGKDGMIHRVFGTNEDAEKWWRIGVKETDDAGKVTGRHYYDARKVFGGIVGASVGARLLSGGGVYKDGNGNTDLIGIPFV